MKTLVRTFSKFVKTNNKARIALKLGYRDTAAISAWIIRGRIPEKKVDAVKKLMGG